jgi:hypothetical protein
LIVSYLLEMQNRFLLQQLEAHKLAILNLERDKMGAERFRNAVQWYFDYRFKKFNGTYSPDELPLLDRDLLRLLQGEETEIIPVGRDGYDPQG